MNGHGIPPSATRPGSGAPSPAGEISRRSEWARLTDGVGLHGLSLLIALVAVAARLPGLGKAPLWVDEAATWWFARMVASGALAEQIRLEPTPPLYYGALGLWMRIFGEGVVAMRFPSVLAGLAAVLVVGVLGKRLFGPGVGLVAAALLAVHPLHVAISREARVYPFLVLAVLGALFLLHRGIVADSGRVWAALALLLGVTGWMHPYAVFLLATVGLAILLAARGRCRLRGLAAVVAGAAITAPWWVLTLPSLRESGAAWSVAEMYRLMPEEARWGRALEISLLGAAYNPFLRLLHRPSTPELLRWPALLAQLWLLWAVARSALDRSDARRLPIGLLALGWILPVLAPWAITRLGPPIYHLGRHDTYVLGPVVLLLAVGWQEVERRRSRVALALLLVLGVAAGHRLVAMHRADSLAIDRQAGRFLSAVQQPDDVVVALGISRLVTEHPARRAGATLAFRSFPPQTDSHPGWSDDRALLEDEERLRREAGELLAELEGETRRILVLTRSSPPFGGRPPSLEWQVDRHWFEALARRGWRRDPEASSPQVGVQVFLAPTSEPSTLGEPTPVGS